MKFRHFTTGLLAVTLAVPAFAADLPVRKAPPLPAAAVVPAFSWTGCYLGGHVGGAWSRTDLNDTTGFIAGTPTTTRVNAEDVIYGGQVGCDYQFDSHWVLGAQGSISGTGIKGTTSQTFSGVAGPFSFTEPTNFDTKTTWIASATGRLGYAMDHWLFYGKGGAAWAHDSYDFNGTLTVCLAGIGCGSPGSLYGSASGTRSGWTVGGGVEWAFAPSWSAFAEYDYYDFGHPTLNFTGTAASPFGGPTTAFSTPVQVTQKIQSFEVGINYHFWSPAAGVMVR